MNMELNNPPITRFNIAVSERVAATAALFGYDFALRLEPVVFHIASTQALNYTGGYWEFYALSNGGFYMAPEGQTRYQMDCPNYYQGELSGDALGIVACLTAYSHLSFGNEQRFAQLCARQFHLLRDYAGFHPEAEGIYRAID
jgi:hypothetical protein